MKKAWAIGGGEPRFTFNEAYQLAKEPEAPAIPPADSSDPAGTLPPGYARTADGKIVPPAGKRPGPGKGKKKAAPAVKYTVAGFGSYVKAECTKPGCGHSEIWKTAHEHKRVDGEAS